MEENEVKIVLEVAQKKDYDRVLHFIRRYYYPEETKIKVSEDEHFCMKALTSGTTIMALDAAAKDAEILGVILSSQIELGVADRMLKDAKRCKCKDFSEILTLLAYLEHKADVCRRFQIDRGLHMHIMGVHPQLKGQSVGTQLIAKCMEVGKELGYKMASIDCTSIYSAHIAENLDMICIETLAFADYKDETGRQIFKPPPPNYEIKTFIKLL